tara:strand:- start:799 stop:1203 length:405 start_codon:yes stop_codon:yes gene_type:complete
MISATIVGRLGQDPDMRETSHGTVCSVSVAADKGYGQNKQTTWVKLSAWRGLGDTLLKLTKGCRVAASGELYEDSWTDSNDVEHKRLKLDANKITVIDWPEHAGAKPPANAEPAPKKAAGKKPKPKYQVDPDMF